MNPSYPSELLEAIGPSIDWKYEMRREAQEVLPSVFVGPYQASKDLNALKNLLITHICCISESREAHLLRPRFPDQFHYTVLDIRDATDQNLISIFPDAMKFIDDCVNSGGRVLVHCGDGLSRSPAVAFVINFSFSSFPCVMFKVLKIFSLGFSSSALRNRTAYAMVKYNMASEDAFQFIQSRRFCAAPNLGFLRQLDAYDFICQAQRTCPNPITRDNSQDLRRKRSDSIDETNDSAFRQQSRKIQIDPDAQQRVPTWGGVNR
ncbi:protein-tyrosine phosphatase-like protein [Melampsora americana]|nr:protein-tyrosine phosphatase-like protein [Melampsora americana]